MPDDWMAFFEANISNFADAIFETAPALIGAFLVVFLGWLFARIARGAVKKLTNGLNRLLERTFRKGALANFRLSAPIMTVVAEIVFWTILFLAVTMAARIAGFSALYSWLNQVVSHIPNVVLGAIIVAIGYFTSVYVGRLIGGRAVDATRESLFLARLAQGFILIVALIIGLDQIGIKVAFLVTLLSVAAGAVLAGFAIAFGFGARDHVSNLIAARAASDELHAGLKIRIGEYTGDVLEVTPSHIALDTADGRLLVPARIIEEQPVEILTGAKEPADG